MGRERDQTAPGLLGAVALALVACGCGSRPDAGEAARPEPQGEEDAGQGDQEEAAQIAAIEQAVNELSRAVHSCWAIGASDDFRLEGTVVLSLAIGSGGASKDVEVVSDETSDPRLTGCLRELWSDYSWPEVFREGDQIQLPPLEFVAPEAQYTVSAAHVEPAKLQEGKLEVSPVLHHRNTGNDAAVLSLLRAGRGARVSLSRHSFAELYFVLSGEAELRDDTARWSGVAGPGTAVYVRPGTPHAWRQRGEGPLVLLRFAAPGGEEALFDPAAGAIEEKGGRRRRKGPPPKLQAAADAPTFALLGGAGEAAILFDASSAGDDAAYLGAVTLKPGAAIPRHTHAESSEYVFLLEGDGEMVVGEESFLVQAGDAIQVPPGIEHAFRVTGGDPVKAIQMYAPAGPEQRFKQAGSVD